MYDITWQYAVALSVLSAAYLCFKLSNLAIPHAKLGLPPPCLTQVMPSSEHTLQHPSWNITSELRIIRISFHQKMDLLTKMSINRHLNSCTQLLMVVVHVCLPFSGLQ